MTLPANGNISAIVQALAITTLALTHPFDDPTLVRIHDSVLAAAAEVDLCVLGPCCANETRRTLTTRKAVHSALVAGRWQGPCFTPGNGRPFARYFDSCRNRTSRFAGIEDELVAEFATQLQQRLPVPWPDHPQATASALSLDVLYEQTRAVVAYNKGVAANMSPAAAVMAACNVSAAGVNYRALRVVKAAFEQRIAWLQQDVDTLVAFGLQHATASGSGASAH